MKQNQIADRPENLIIDPPLSRFLFSDKRAGWIWLLLRVWLGVQWVEASLHKISDPKWVQTGESIKGFWMNAVKIPESGRPPIAFDWYRDFIQWLIDIQAEKFMGVLVAYGELLVGIALILGAFVGFAAFFGAVMNWNFIMAGTASSNGLLLILAVLLILGWKVAGYVGADYYLLRWLGVPWKAGAEEDKSKLLTPA
jgi:thiosulfate dehydrogenase [quinone] large subunit